jgi:hypothetical protein
MWISHVASKTLSAHADPTTPAGEDRFFGRLLPHPPTAFPFWQESRLQRETIEACSGFTCFSACAFAPRLHRGLPRRLQPADCSSSAAPVTTGRTDNSPGGTYTRWPSRPRRSLCNLRLSSHQTSFRVALPAVYSVYSSSGVGARRFARPFRETGPREPPVLLPPPAPSSPPSLLAPRFRLPDPFTAVVRLFYQPIEHTSPQRELVPDLA